MIEVNSWFRDHAEYQKHLDKIKDPATWPQNLVRLLHLKNTKRIEKKDQMQYGVIYCVEPGGGYKVSGFGSEAWTETYRSAEELMEAGWVVD